jgi:hypothetical protein
MNKGKCPSCGLVNPATAWICRRCDTPLADEAATAESGIPASPVVVPVRPRSFLQRAGWIIGATLFVLAAAYLSLLLTSDDLSFDQRQSVEAAIVVLRQKGFDRQVFVLSHLARYRSTDNWWNRYVGHHEAYAATNFPFEVVTLYPEFFTAAVDDTERAAILLHESYHLFGSGEEKALEKTWREKSRIGWVGGHYGQTKVWRNTREQTADSVPSLFKCGPDGHADCTK